jgi:hypothetical protein
MNPQDKEPVGLIVKSEMELLVRDSGWLSSFALLLGGLLI